MRIYQPHFAYHVQTPNNAQSSRFRLGARWPRQLDTCVRGELRVSVEWENQRSGFSKVSQVLAENLKKIYKQKLAWILSYQSILYLF